MSEEADGRGGGGSDGRSAVAGDDESGRRRGRPCPLCGASLFRRHCKYVCPQHGVVFDCADPFN